MGSWLGLQVANTSWRDTRVRGAVLSVVRAQGTQQSQSEIMAGPKPAGEEGISVILRSGNIF